MPLRRLIYVLAVTLQFSMVMFGLGLEKVAAPVSECGGGTLLFVLLFALLGFVVYCTAASDFLIAALIGLTIF